MLGQNQNWERLATSQRIHFKKFEVGLGCSSSSVELLPGRCARSSDFAWASLNLSVNLALPSGRRTRRLIPRRAFQGVTPTSTLSLVLPLTVILTCRSPAFTMPSGSFTTTCVNHRKAGKLPTNSTGSTWLICCESTAWAVTTSPGVSFRMVGRGQCEFVYPSQSRRFVTAKGSRTNVTASSASARCEFSSVARIGASSSRIVPTPWLSAIVAFVADDKLH